MSKIIKNGEYNDLIYALKSQIQSAQIKAAVSVNPELPFLIISDIYRPLS
jgi:hypothetical protein